MPRRKKLNSDAAPKVSTAKRDPQAVLHALHRYLTGEESGGEHRSYCPVCEEPGKSTSPSASINPVKGVWKCLGKCGGGGSINGLLFQMKQNGFNYNAERMRGRSADPKAKPYKTAPEGEIHPDLQPAAIEASHKRLMNSTVVLDRLLEERGLNREVVERFKIGWDGDRYRIPVKDASGNYVNVRRYKLKAPAKQKMYNLKGCGSGSMLFPMEALESDTIVLCEGEMDALLLNQYGIPAVTGTHGAATFKPELARLFSGKQVYICYDNDEAGRVGARKAAKLIGSFTEHVFVVALPLPADGADVTDFLYLESHSADDFRALMENSQAAKPAVFSEGTVFKDLPADGVRVSLEDSMGEEAQGITLDLTVTVAGKQNPPYFVPKRFTVTCGITKGAPCKVCPVALRDGQMTHEYSRDDPALFEYIESSAEANLKIMKRASGARCTDHSEFDVEERFLIEELIVGNSVEDRVAGEDQRPVTRVAYSVGTHKTAVNTAVRLVGANTISPRNSRLAFMAWKNEPVQTSLDKFSMTEDEMHELSIFKPRDEQRPLERALEIAGDLARNVTQIYGRDLLHVAYDFVWHSPLSFRVEGRLMEKGWLEMMVVGDTRTGKSETATKLAEHYKAGVVKSCEGATFAGLVGGVQQIGSNWVTTWGAIPLNDRRLVVLDEVSGLKDRDVIENMSSIRSSGKAQIVKINSEETSARTRLIWITNPADGSMLDEKPDVGIAALRTVVKANEDIARFDFVAAAREGDVKAQMINTVHKPKPTVFTSKLCERMVLWAWSLKSEDITFTPDAQKEAREIANRVSTEYVPDPPLLQAANVRWKLYRIAAALAVRTFSVRWHPQESTCEVVVTREHVQDAYTFLNMLYDSPGMQYKRKSQRTIAAAETARRRRNDAKLYLIQHSDNVLHALRTVGGSTFRVRDFTEFGGMDGPGAQAAVKALTGYGLLKNKSRGDITMDPVLVSLLRELEDEGY